MIVDYDLAVDFLRELYARTPPAGWINLFSVDHATGERTVAWAPLAELDQLEAPITKLGLRGDVWFGVSPRRERLDGGRRGGVEECLSIPGVWLDLDVVGPGHKTANLPTMDQARTLLQGWRPPDATVNSGHGYQLWWRAPRAIPAVPALGMLAEWNHKWQRRARAIGVHVDNVSNIDRVMRLPGTMNWKGGQEVPVTVRPRWEG